MKRLKTKPKNTFTNYNLSYIYTHTLTNMITQNILHMYVYVEIHSLHESKVQKPESILKVIIRFNIFVYNILYFKAKKILLSFL